MENEQPTAGNYGGFYEQVVFDSATGLTNKCPPRRQLYIRESLPTSSFRSVPEINEVYRRKKSRKVVLDQPANRFSLKRRGAGRNGCIRRLVLDYAVNSRPLPSEKIGEKPHLRFFSEGRGRLYTGAG